VAQAIGNLVRDPDFVAYLTHRSFGRELFMPGRDSTLNRPVRLSVQLYHYDGGRILLLSHDVTALEQAEAMRRDFVANVSHEIRTPLTVLAGFVETLQTLELEPTELESYLALMAQQAQRMQSLVNDLLMLSKLEGSSVPGVDTWTSVPSLMQQLSQDAHALTHVINSGEQRVHDLDFDDCGFSGEIAGIATELHSAMSNLVSNAIRYTPSGGHIRVSFYQLADGQAVFEVTDSGGGIAPEHLPRLTERFYRVDRSRSRETGGTGLGLAIAKHVVQRHGATLTIDSKLGQGSTFRIHFPAVRLRSALQ
jgi:two-component system phosphate regulon sensor histidine kinase PhoR